MYVATDQGDLVVTKGDQYDVREASSSDGEKGGETISVNRCRCARDTIRKEQTRWSS